MDSKKYIGMDVHKESISIAVRNDVGKIVMECVIETKANIILDVIHGLRGELQVTFEEGTWATWLYDLLKANSLRPLLHNGLSSAALQSIRYALFSSRRGLPPSSQQSQQAQRIHIHQH